MAITGKIRQKVRDGSLREMWREAKWMFTYIRRYRAVVGIHILLGILGTALSLLIFQEWPALSFWVALAIMGAGAYLASKDEAPDGC